MMYPEEQKTNMIEKMKNSLALSNTIKIKMIREGLFTVDNIKSSLEKILPPQLFQSMNVYYTSTGDIMISIILNNNDRVMFHLYDYINEVFHAFFQYNMDKIRSILTNDELIYLLDKNNTNLFYSLELYYQGQLTIRI